MSKSLRWALCGSVALHAVVLAVRFVAPPPAKWEPPSPVIIAVLVNAQTEKSPEKAAAIAQVSLDGGGNLDEKGWMPSSPVERGQTKAKAPAKASEGDKEKEVAALEEEVARLMAQAKPSSWSAKTDPREPSHAKREESDQDKQALDLAARIDAQASAYASRPKKAFVGLQATQSDLAAWVEGWQRKVEGMGNAFYPEQAKGRVRGTLILTAAIRKDGRIESIQIDRSSGHRLLDESAQRILALAAPFEPFDPAMAKKVDILYITRQWRFGPAGLERLESATP